MKNQNNFTYEKKKSKKILLKDSLMSFDEDIVVFGNVDANDILEITMATGTNNHASKFKPDYFKISELIIGEEVITTWLLNSGSLVNVKYKLFDNSEGMRIAAGAGIGIGVILKPISNNFAQINRFNETQHKRRSSNALTLGIFIGSPENEEIKETTENNIIDNSISINKSLNKISPNKPPISNKIPEKKISSYKASKFINTADVSNLIKEVSVLEKQQNINISPFKPFNPSGNSSISDSSSNNILSLSANLLSSNISDESTNSINNLRWANIDNKQHSARFDNINACSGSESGNQKNKNNPTKIEIYRKDSENSDMCYDKTIQETNSSIMNDTIKEINNKSIFKDDLTTKFKQLNYDEFTIHEKEIHIPESFCEGFFIAGLPTENSAIIAGGDDYLAPCTHENCSVLSSYKPEILLRYPLKDNNRLELNSLVASLCFPLGIKLCYSTDVKNIRAIKNYSTAIINQDGSRYYLMTYHYYIKYDKNEFSKLYSINPIKEFLNLERILTLYENNEVKKKFEDKLEKQLEICTIFNFNENLYVPFCASLISKHPYTKQMEKCIQSILYQMADTKSYDEDILKQILYLTREIPIPPLNKKLCFYIPNDNEFIEIVAPIYKDLPLINDNLLNLLEIFSIENIMIIHNLMLLEQKILFVGDEYCQLSEVIESFTTLLYPIKWINTFIPILSEEMTKYLQSFMPFIMGIDQSLLEHAKSYFAEEERIFIIYIKKDLIDMSSNAKGKKLKKKELLDKLPIYPQEIEKFITKRLSDIKKLLEKYKSKQDINKLAVEICIRETFVKAFVNLFGDYNKFNELVNQVPIFNTDKFLENKSEKDKPFYAEFTETQIFRNFLQFDAKEYFPYFYNQIEKYKHLSKVKKSKKRSNSIISFKRSSISIVLNDEDEIDYKDLILNSKLNKYVKNGGGKGSDSNGQHNISTMNLSTLTNENSNSNKNAPDNLINHITTYEKADTYLIPPYFVNNLLLSRLNSQSVNTDKKILSENKRIFNHMKKLDMSLIPNKYNRYIIPELREKELSLNNRDSYMRSNSEERNDLSNNIQNTRINTETKVEHLKKNRIFFRTSTLKGELSAYAQPEEMISNINQCLKMIFTNQKLNVEQKKDLYSIFKKHIGREHLSKEVFQQKFKENVPHCLSKDSFDDLFQLLFEGLLELEGEQTKINFQLARLLTKSTFYYYKTELNNKHYFIYQELNNKKGSFSVWKNEKFWMEWICLEKCERAHEYDPSEDDDLNFEILIDISRIMMSLNVESKFIVSCLVDILGKKYIQNVKLLDDLSTVILKQLKNINELNI